MYIQTQVVWIPKLSNSSYLRTEIRRGRERNYIFFVSNSVIVFVRTVQFESSNYIVVKTEDNHRLTPNMWNLMKKLGLFSQECCGKSQRNYSQLFYRGGWFITDLFRRETYITDLFHHGTCIMDLVHLWTYITVWFISEHVSLSGSLWNIHKLIVL